MVHLILNLWQWIVLVLAGGFFIFLGSAEMVVNAQSKIPATTIERLYYTGYVFSTLGNGGFTPGNTGSQIFTLFYSIIGFGMLTIGITYLLSVTNAVLVKKNLATFISSMGKNPPALYRFFTISDNGKQFLKRVDNLVELIDTHTNNHLSFPIVHYFLTSDRKRAAAIHIVSLYEATRILRMRYHDQNDIIGQLDRLDTSIMNFIHIAHNNRQPQKSKSSEVQTIRQVWRTVEPVYSNEEDLEDGLTTQFGDLLISQGWDWKHVYVGEK